MKLSASTRDPLARNLDLLVTITAQNKNLMQGFLGKLDKKLAGDLKRLLKKEEFVGDRGQTRLLYTKGKLKSDHLFIVGVGTSEKLTGENLREAGSAVQTTAKQIKAEKISLVIDQEIMKKLGAANACQAVGEGILLSSYEFSRYTKPKKSVLNDVDITVERKQLATVVPALSLAEIVSKGVNLARDLTNTSGSDMQPENLARAAKSLKGVRTRIHNLAAIKRMKMGAFLSVARGSPDCPPYFIEMHYTPKSRSKKKIAIVGKGVTFDSGGYSIKTAKGMETMKCDKAGAAAVIGLMSVIASLKPKVAVSGYIAATENMVDSGAQKPGDVCRAMDGTTIEVINTDAEGRLTLADALIYAARKKPDYMIDMATLTGACVVALGMRYSGIMGNDQDLIDRLIAASKFCGENLWPLPLADEYREETKSPIATLRNAGGPYAGSITAALFLEHFAGKNKWAHIDIAGPAFTEKPLPYTPKGASGVMVRTLARFIKQF